MEFIFNLHNIEDIDLTSVQHLQDNGYSYLIACHTRIINELSKLLNTIESKKDKFALMDILEKKY